MAWLEPSSGWCQVPPSRQGHSLPAQGQGAVLGAGTALLCLLGCSDGGGVEVT